MKKLLSIMLTLCMLLTMFIVPTAATGEQAEEKLYYKFDFSEAALYTDYENPNKEGIAYDFTAVGYNGKYAIEHGTINGVDGLRIRASGDTKNINIVPLKEDGSPIVLEAGKEYVVKWDFSVKRLAKAWSRAHIVPYSTIDGSGISKTGIPNYEAYYTTETENEDGSTTTVYNKLIYAEGKTSPHRGMYAGPQLVYWDNPAKLKNVTETLTTPYNLKEGAFTESTSDSYKGTVSENGDNYTYTKTLTMLSDEELASTYNVTANSDGSYTFTGVNGEHTFNNLLSLELPGTDNYYAQGENADALTTAEAEDGTKYYQMYGEYYITGLTVYEADYDLATVTMIDGTDEAVLSCAPGEAIEYPTLKADMSGDRVWSLSADEYVAVPTVAGTEDITVYAYNTGVVGFENYLTSTYFTHPWYRNTSFSTDVAYSGTTSMKFRNYNVNALSAQPDDWETNWTNYYAYNELTDTFSKLTTEAAPEYEADKYFVSRGQGQTEQGTFTILDLNAKGAQTYTKKVTLKYYIPESNESGIKLQVFQHATESIWWGKPVAVSSVVTIPADATDGWQTIEILVTAADVYVYQEGKNQGLYIKATAATDSKYAIAYFDDVVVEDVVLENKVVYHYNDGATEDVVITDVISAGTYAIDRVPETAPEGKYFAGWYTDEACTVAATASVSASITGTIDLYAKWNEYKTEAEYDFRGAASVDVNAAYMKDGVYTTSIKEGGWLSTTYTDEGLVYTHAGRATKFDPTATTTSTFNENNGDKYVAYNIPGTVGQIYSPAKSWLDANTYTIKDANGDPFVVKPNTKYAAVITYELQGEGKASIALVAGRKISNATSTPTNSSASTNFYANNSTALAFTNLTASEETQTHTFTIETGDLADTVPVLGFYSHVDAVKTKRVESVTIDGVEYTEWTVGETTYYPYEFISRPKFVVKDISIVELDSSVTFIDGETETVVSGVKGNTIEYPALNANVSYDYVWSLSADEYIAVPETMDGDITVYAYKNPVIGFENYASHMFGTGVNVSVTDEVVNSGDKSFKYEDIDYAVINAESALEEITTGEGDDAVTTIAWLTPTNQFYWKNAYYFDAETESMVRLSGDTVPEFEEGKYFRNRNGMKEQSIALWKLEAGKTYRVNFKYYVENISANMNVNAIVGSNNIWASTINVAQYVIAADSETGKWLEGEIYLTNTAESASKSFLYMVINNSAAASGDLIYFDDFSYAEVDTVYFEIPEGAEVVSGGTVNENILTVYVESGAEIAAPVVVDADGNVVAVWYDKNGDEATEFVVGETYTYKSFIYGDCNGDGYVDTKDLATLKLYLAGAGETAAGGDCNGDGYVDTKDLATLKLYLAGAGTLGPQ